MHIQQNRLSFYSRLLSFIYILVHTVIISVVIFGIGGYVCSQIFHNLKIEFWALILITGFIIVSLIMIYKTKYAHLESTFSLRNFILGLLPYLLLIPGILAVILSTRIQLSYHGAFHMGYINQILSGISPPENPVLPGYPANNYWLYHALLSVIVYVFHITPPTASAALNFGALAGALYYIRRSLAILSLSNNNSFIRSFYTLLILFGANLLGSVHILGTYILKGDITIESLIIMINRDNFVLLGDLRLQNLFMKFLNFAGVGIGVLYFCFALYVALQILRGKLTSGKIFLLSIAVLGALMFHTTIGIFTLFILPASLLITIIFVNKELLKTYIQCTKTLEITTLFIAIVFLFLPIIHYIYTASSALPAQIYFGNSIKYNLISIFSAAYPLIGLVAIALIFSHKRRSAAIVFFGTLSVMGYALSSIINLPDFNQYKFIYLSTISLCFLSVFGLDYLYYDLRGRFTLAGKVIVYVLLLILSINLLFVGTQYMSSKRFRENTYYYDNKRIFLEEGALYKKSYEWIRENSPTGIVVILPLPSKDTGKEGQMNGNIYIIGERLPYVAFGGFFAEGIEEYNSRVENINLFYSESTPIEKKIEILGEFEKFSKQRPSILMIPKVNLESISLYLDNLELIYSGKDANLYSFKNN